MERTSRFERDKDFCIYDRSRDWKVNDYYVMIMDGDVMIMGEDVMIMDGDVVIMDDDVMIMDDNVMNMENLESKIYASESY